MKGDDINKNKIKDTCLCKTREWSPKQTPGVGQDPDE